MALPDRCDADVEQIGNFEKIVASEIAKKCWLHISVQVDISGLHFDLSFLKVLSTFPCQIAIRPFETTHKNRENKFVHKSGFFYTNTRELPGVALVNISDG